MPSRSSRSILLLLVVICLCLVASVNGQESEVVHAVPHHHEEVIEAEVPIIPSQDEAGPTSHQEDHQEEHYHGQDTTANDPQTNGSNNQNQATAEEAHCAWGTACHPESNNSDEGDDAAAATATVTTTAPEEAINTHPTNEPEVPPPLSNANANTNTRQAENASANTNAGTTATATTTATTTGHIPFVKHPSNSQNVAPPEGFAITARVYTDPNDKLAHFTDDQEGSHITLPYWECGATGSTTSPLPIKHAYFRHALSGTKPAVWSGTEYGPHPQLIVALKCVEMTLNSGETKQLNSGDVVLLEDVVSGGHKCTSCHTNGDHHHHHPQLHHHHGSTAGANDSSMSYLVLTLPQHYHHVGRDRTSLKKASMEKKVNPCANNNNNGEQQQQKGTSAFVGRQQQPQTKQQQQQQSQQSQVTSNDDLSTPSWDRIKAGDTRSSSSEGGVAPLREGKLRKILLGAVGISLSTLMADFLGKVAPLWVAVGIGGTCFVVGGTFACVQGGDYLWTEVEMWQERKRLDLSYVDDYEVQEEEEEMMNENRGSEAKKPKPVAMVS